MSATQGVLFGAEPITVHLDLPSANGFTELQITPGVIDAASAELYARAKCFMLAGAINERTGWPPAVAFQFVHGKWKWCHVGVQLPDGRFLDIEAIREFSQVAWDLEATYGPRVLIRTYSSYEECHRALLPGREVVPWREQGGNEVANALTEGFADTLIQLAKDAK